MIVVIASLVAILAPCTRLGPALTAQAAYLLGSGLPPRSPASALK